VNSHLDLSIDAIEVAADFDGAGFPQDRAYQAAVRRKKTGVHDGKLQESAGAQDAVDLLQSQIVAGKIHEGHDGGGEIEPAGGKRQLPGAGGGIADAGGFVRFPLGCRPHEGGGDVYRKHARAALGQQAGVVPVTAADVETGLAGHIRKFLEERRSIDFSPEKTSGRLPPVLAPSCGFGVPVSRAARQQLEKFLRVGNPHAAQVLRKNRPPVINFEQPARKHYDIVAFTVCIGLSRAGKGARVQPWSFVRRRFAAVVLFNTVLARQRAFFHDGTTTSLPLTAAAHMRRVSV